MVAVAVPAACKRVLTWFVPSWQNYRFHSTKGLLAIGVSNFITHRSLSDSASTTHSDSDTRYTPSKAFGRKESQFRNTIEKGGQFLPEANRYHLYVSLACPWAHRTLIVRKIKGLEKVISVSVVHYLMLDNGWEFVDSSAEKSTIDHVNGFRYIRQIYSQQDPNYSGRNTVPILYDRKTRRIVNNESSEIIRMLNSAFNEFSLHPEIDLYPEKMRKQIDQWNDIIYNGINNGVYRAGFATDQHSHETASKQVYEALLKVENKLKSGGGPYFFGDMFTETDVRLFTSLIRFDPVYHTHFKCNLMQVKDLPQTLAWMKAVYDYQGIKDTVNMDHIKRHYYMSHRQINPTGIVPLYNGPVVGD